MEYEELKEQHAVHGGVAEFFRRMMVEQIEIILAKNKLTLGVPVESRVKSVSSIINKDKRKALQISSITDLDDFVGIRLIMLFKRDLEKVITCLKENFVILKAEDKLEDLAEDKFGYQSYHFVIQAPQEWLMVPSFAGFGGLKVEVQVRTLSQHIWAATSHKLQYKKEQNVPLPLRRAIHRVSALLEVVDFEFERVLSEREDYIEKIAVDKEINNEATLDVDLLKLIANNELPVINKDVNEDEDFDDLLSELINNNILTAGELLEHLRSGLPEALKDDKRKVKAILKSWGDDEEDMDDEDRNSLQRCKSGVYYTHVGLIRMSMSYAIGDDYIKNHDPDFEEEE